jgi:tetratricopeptide (TPR) repeat protein
VAEEVRKLLAFSIFKQAEARETQGDREGANRDFFRLAEDLPDEETAQVALYRAAEGLRALGREAEAARVYERLARSYRGSRYAQEALALSAQIFSVLGDWGEAGRNYEELYRSRPGEPAASDDLFRAALARERAKEPAEAERLYGEFSRQFPGHPRLAEARFRQGEVLRILGLDRDAAQRYQEAWETSGPEEASGYRAMAALALGKMRLAELSEVKLAGDLEAAVSRKEALLAEALAHLARAASLPFAETLTESLYRAGEAFEHMKEALLKSERPADLSEEEAEEYAFLLEEKAFPLEERAVGYYRNGISVARKAGVHTLWVDRMYERLEVLVPWAYQRREEPSLAWEPPDRFPRARELGEEAAR